jgi:hypothetical protein
VVERGGEDRRSLRARQIETYFVAEPRIPESVPWAFPVFDLLGLPTTVRAPAVQVKPGESKTIDVVLTATGPEMGAWRVKAYPGIQNMEQSPVAFAFDRSAGKSGDVLKLTLSALADYKPPKDGSAFVMPFRVESTAESGIANLAGGLVAVR